MKLPAWIRCSVTERSVSNSFQTHFHNVERNKREKRRSKNRREHGGIHICKELDKSTKQLNHNPQSMTETNKQVQHSDEEEPEEDKAFNLHYSKSHMFRPVTKLCIEEQTR